MIILAQLDIGVVSYVVVSLLLYFIAILVVVSATEPKKGDEKRPEPDRFIEYRDYRDDYR